MIERTLSIIKPDGVERHLIGKIIAKFEENELYPVRIEMKHLSQKEAEGFYEVHKGKPFFQELVKFMSSSPVVLMVLEGEDAVSKNRRIMGATDPAKADQGTLRQMYAKSIDKNTVHGSDSIENAKKEIEYFFK